MTRCFACHKHTHLVEFTCTTCKHVFCTKCRLPEIHHCVDLQKLKDEQHGVLAERLNREATKDNHGIQNRM